VRPERPADVPLFSSLSTASFMSLIDKLDAWEAEPDAIVVAEGEESDSVFVVVRGCVRVEANNAVLARLGAGSFFGEMALLSKKKRTANVIAEERTELLEISRATLESLQQKDKSVADALERFCRSRLIDNLARTSTLFTGIDPVVARRALTGFAARKVSSGTKVVEQDGVAPGLFIVLQGALDVVAQSELGPVRLKELGPGDVFGEMSLLSRDPASATVSASSDSTLLVLPRVAFDEFVVGHPALRARLEALASERRAQNEKFLPDETSSAVLV
jgi:cAMP-dependent protein kinase regulator